MAEGDRLLFEVRQHPQTRGRRVQFTSTAYGYRTSIVGSCPPSAAALTLRRQARTATRRPTESANSKSTSGWHESTRTCGSTETSPPASTAKDIPNAKIRTMLKATGLTSPGFKPVTVVEAAAVIHRSFSAGADLKEAKLSSETEAEALQGIGASGSSKPHKPRFIEYGSKLRTCHGTLTTMDLKDSSTSNSTQISVPSLAGRRAAVRVAGVPTTVCLGFHGHGCGPQLVGSLV